MITIINVLLIVIGRNSTTIEKKKSRTNFNISAIKKIAMG